MPITKLNPLKKKVLRLFTGNFQNSKRTPQLDQLDRASVKKILVTRPNHRLGNQLLLTPLIQTLHAEFPKAHIHLVLNGSLSTVLFVNYPYVQKIYQLPKKPFKNIVRYLGIILRLKRTTYDLAITGNQKSNSSKLFVRLARARYKVYDSGLHTEAKPLHIAQYPIYNLKTFLDPTVDLSGYDYPRLSIQLSKEELHHGKEVLRNLVGTDQKIISIFTFATGDKCHVHQWWSDFYEKLLTEFHDYTILEVLPMENVSQIDFRAAHYYSRDLREIAAVIANTAVFIGADSGMMHLAACTATPIFGLFNVTKTEVYKPYGGWNQAIDTCSTNIDQLVEKIKVIIAKV